MSDGLFDWGDSSVEQAPSTPALARDEQVAAIRMGFDSADILTQQDRHAFVESVVLEPVTSLRELTAVQARRVIDRLKELQAPRKSSTGNAWADREEDTWIDRL